MTRHSFIRISKLPDARGRIDYISNPKRQEHLGASYSTVESEFWKRLSEQSQFDFWRSHQKTEKCIEARALIIALPESLQAVDPETSGNSLPNNSDLSTVSNEPQRSTTTRLGRITIFIWSLLTETFWGKTVVKRAPRNMFYDENGRHVRTKKEIQNEHGEVRPGCQILKKGDVYDIKWFSSRKDIFKSKAFLQDVKQMYTDLINQLISPEEH